MELSSQILHIVAVLEGENPNFADVQNVLQKFAELDDVNLVNIQDQGGVPALLRVMATYGDDVEVARLGCRIIGNMARKDKDLGNIGEFEAVVRAMRLHWRDMETVKWAARSMGKLAKNHSGMFGPLGGCEMVTKATRVFGNHDVETAVWTCFAVHKLCSGDDSENASAFGRVGGCQIVIEVLNTHDNNPVVAYLGCQALSDLASCCISNIIKIRQFDGCKTVLRVMETHEHNAKVTQAGCSVVSNLIELCESNDAAIFAPIKGCETVLKVLRNHSMDSKVAECGCDALGQLASNAENSNKIGMTGGCELVLEILRVHNSSREVLCSGLVAIERLAGTSTDNKAKLIMLSVVAIVSSLMALHPRTLVSVRGEEALQQLI